ncbi:MAG: hypothetical protein IKL55_04760 [Clostridia bacterium]|nr:hypothetical protein [Clostridia bacterium]
MTKVKKIFIIMLVLWLSCNQVCYADVITTRQILTPISVVAGTICAVVLVMYAICFFIFKSMRNKSQGNETEREQINLKEESFNNKIYFWVIMLSICLLIFFRMQFRVSLVLLAVPVIAIITSKIFRKKDNIKIISITIMLISIVLIGIYCYYIYAYNNQFLKHSQYINGIRSMGTETTDLHALINAAIENNKKTSSKKIVVKCVLRENKFGINFTNKRSEKSYTTVQELEWLLDNINTSTSTISFDYDKNHQFIECIEVFVSIPENSDE